MRNNLTELLRCLSPFQSMNQLLLKREKKFIVCVSPKSPSLVRILLPECVYPSYLFRITAHGTKAFKHVEFVTRILGKWLTRRSNPKTTTFQKADQKFETFDSFEQIREKAASKAFSWIWDEIESRKGPLSHRTDLKGHYHRMFVRPPVYIEGTSQQWDSISYAFTMWPYQFYCSLRERIIWDSMDKIRKFTKKEYKKNFLQLKDIFQHLSTKHFSKCAHKPEERAQR